jgi:hypothetical protein
MKRDGRRITLVTRPSLASQQEREWNFHGSASSRIIAAGSFTVLRYALDAAMREMAHDVERLVIDRTGTPAQYLDLLASLPEEFVGDVLFIRADGGAFLSAAGRGAGRMMYNLMPVDLNFYLETHDLLAPTVELRQSA